MNEDWLAIIIAISIVVFVVVIIVTIKCFKNAQKRFVREKSKKLNKVLDLNKKTDFISLKPNVLLITFNLDSRRKFFAFDCDKKINEYIKKNRDLFSKYIQISEKNSELYKDYLYSLKIISSSPTFFEYRLPFYLNKRQFIDIENTLIKDMMVLPDTDFSLAVHWSYTSTGRRVHLENNYKIDREEIITRYQFFFYNRKVDDVDINSDATKLSSERKEKESSSYTYFESSNYGFESKYKPFTEDELKIKGLIPSLNKNAFSKKQLKHILSDCGIKASEENISFLICEADLKKQKRADIYVQKQYGTIDNVILCSSNDNGIIYYDNFIKDSEYDYAIDRLCKERRIIPISNLAFLKNDSSISLNGMTVSDINYFDFLVKHLLSSNSYVSAKYVKSKIKCKITEAEYDDCFVYSLLKYCGFLTEVSGIKGLFSYEGNKERFSFLLYMLGKSKSIDAFDVIYNIKDIYGVEYNIYSIIYDINKSNSGLYYNEETEKIYINKDAFYEEVL